MMREDPPKAPFPYFGGKSRVAYQVWERFGDVPNYVEPFAGSLAVLLARPTAPKTETINDLDCYLANFWRAVQHDPAAVAVFADWPVNEADLLARHTWLLKQTTFRDRMRTEPEFYDAKIAGWWVWGICAWIGSGWCRVRGEGHPPDQLPQLGDAGRGIHRKLPHLGDAGRGIHRKLPHLGDAGREAYLSETFGALAFRLRHVRVACGAWDRVLGESVTVKHGITGVFLDPPYADEEHSIEYGMAEGTTTADAARWALENGDDPLLKIAFCGYEGSIVFPESWDCLEWKAQGGYGNQSENGRGRENSHRERIWFSPACKRIPQTANLFEQEEESP
jgi:hypothetical protein